MKEYSLGDDIDMKELKKSAFIVDIIPKNFKLGGMFMMSGYWFIHIKNQYCMLVTFSDEPKIELPRA